MDINFCNKECNKYNIILKDWTSSNNKKIINTYIIYLNYEKIKLFIYLLIKNNWELIDNIIKKNKKKINKIIKSNNNNNFFKFYINNLFTVLNKCNSYQNTYIEFYKLINYNNFIDIITLGLLIINDLKLCNLIINFNIKNINIKKLDLLIINTKFNINYFNIILNNIIPNQRTDWGDIKYTTAYSMCKSLLILSKYYKNPIKKLGIKLVLNKINSFNQSKKYISNKLKKNNINITDDVNNYDKYLFLLKKNNINLWETIKLLFNSIYPKHVLSNVHDSIINNNVLEIENNKIGIFCYILIINNKINQKFLHNYI